MALIAIKLGAMTRKPGLTARQITAICKGAARAGYIPIVQIGDVAVRLVPENAASVTVKPVNRIDELLAARPDQPAPQDRPGIAIQSKLTELARSDRQHWNKNETKEQKAARHAKVTAKWETDLLRSDLEHRERRVIEQLVSRTAEPQHVSTIADAGPVTMERLELRGLIEFTKSAKNEIETVTLTKKGRGFLAELNRRRGSGYL
ncbi:hypothetical protein [Mesorhizobium sp. NPDC059025]|uniref:hypothetical protein n=1 Tax=unclassified Mesorhizobium TaxID=325217 RepID=UPI003688AFF0